MVSCLLIAGLLLYRHFFRIYQVPFREYSSKQFRAVDLGYSYNRCWDNGWHFIAESRGLLLFRHGEMDPPAAGPWAAYEHNQQHHIYPPTHSHLFAFYFIIIFPLDHIGSLSLQVLQSPFATSLYHRSVAPPTLPIQFQAPSPITQHQHE